MRQTCVILRCNQADHKIFSNMAQGTSLTNLYAELNKFGQNQDFERALKAANKILQESSAEKEAFHCKVVCLINLERFSDALNAINKEKSMHSELCFEKAYCEYRLNRTLEAVTTLRSHGSLDNRCKELLAQVTLLADSVDPDQIALEQYDQALHCLPAILLNAHNTLIQKLKLYRLEEYHECYDLYRDLIKNSQDDFDQERETNLAAVLASLQMWGGESMEDPGLSEGSYELCYNHSCYLIGQGDLSRAEEKLRKAEELCKENFADEPDMTEEEMEEELAIIRVQCAYILQSLGRNQEALTAYNQVMKNKPSDVGLMAVLSNNVVAINKDQNVFDSKRKMKVATGSNLKHKLSSKQRQYIEINQCLLHMYTNQGDQCHQLATKLRNDFPDNDIPVLIEAAQFIKEKQVQQAIELLEKFSASHPEKSVSVQLAVAQFHLSHGTVYKACDALKGLGDLQYKPGVVSALVTMYMSQEDRSEALDVLEKAVSWTRKHQPKSEALEVLMKANTNFHIKYGSPQDAAKMLEELRKVSPKDPRILAQLISAYSKFDPAKAQSVSRELPSVDQVAKSVDVDALEAAFSSMGPKYMKKVGKAEPSPGPSGDSSSLIQKKKKHRKRKTKLPKNYDPDVIPDPERWLPRRERSYYRGKRKDKKRDIGKGPQGATSAATDLDASKSPSAGTSDTGSPRPGSAVSPGSTASHQLPQGPRQQKPAQAQKKKKKKGGGGKW